MRKEKICDSKCQVISISWRWRDRRNKVTRRPTTEREITWGEIYSRNMEWSETIIHDELTPNLCVAGFLASIWADMGAWLWLYVCQTSTAHAACLFTKATVVRLGFPEDLVALLLLLFLIPDTPSHLKSSTNFFWSLIGIELSLVLSFCIFGRAIFYLTVSIVQCRAWVCPLLLSQLRICTSRCLLFLSDSVRSQVSRLDSSWRLIGFQDSSRIPQGLSQGHLDIIFLSWIGIRYQNPVKGYCRQSRYLLSLESIETSGWGENSEICFLQ